MFKEYKEMNFQTAQVLKLHGLRKWRRHLERLWGKCGWNESRSGPAPGLGNFDYLLAWYFYLVLVFDM
jgi:hypothetical protein